MLFELMERICGENWRNEIIKINIDTGQKKYYKKYSQILVKKYLPIYIKELIHDLPDEYYIICPSYKNNYLQIIQTSEYTLLKFEIYEILWITIISEKNSTHYRY